jgi:TolB-like protein
MNMKNHLMGMVIVCISIAYSQQKTNIAVMDLEGKGITKTEASVLTDKFRSELINTNRFNVVERNRMNEILVEQGFQQTGCTTQECVVEMGQLIGVERITAGSVGKIGAMYLVSIRLIDVASGEIIKEISEEVEGTIEEVVKVGIANAAKRIAGIEADKADKTDKVVKEAAPAPVEKKKPDKKKPKSHKKLGLSIAFNLRFMGFESGDEQNLTGFSLYNEDDDSWTSITGISGLTLYPWPRFGVTIVYHYIMNPIDGDFNIQETGSTEKHLDYVSADGHIYGVILSGNIKLSEKFRGFLGVGNGMSKFKTKFTVPDVNTGTSGNRIHADLNIYNGDRIEDIFNAPQEDLQVNSNSFLFFLRTGIEWRPITSIGVGLFYYVYFVPILPYIELEYTITDFNDSSIEYEKGIIEPFIAQSNWGNIEIAITGYF